MVSSTPWIAIFFPLFLQVYEGAETFSISDLEDVNDANIISEEPLSAFTILVVLAKTTLSIHFTRNVCRASTCASHAYGLARLILEVSFSTLASKYVAYLPFLCYTLGVLLLQPLRAST